MIQETEFYLCSLCKKFQKPERSEVPRETVQNLALVGGNPLDGEMYICGDCSVTCDSIFTYKYYKKFVHGSVKIFECDFCGKSCLAISQPEIHLTTHTCELAV